MSDIKKSILAAEDAPVYYIEKSSSTLENVVKKIKERLSSQ